MSAWAATAAVQYSLHVKSSAGCFPSSALTHWQRARLITPPEEGRGPVSGRGGAEKSTAGPFMNFALFPCRLLPSSPRHPTHKRAMRRRITIIFSGFSDDGVNAKRSCREGSAFKNDAVLASHTSWWSEPLGINLQGTEPVLWTRHRAIYKTINYANAYGNQYACGLI